MSGSGIIDLSVGLVIVFGVTAALSCAATELIARLLGLRGVYLLRGLHELLDGDAGETDLARAGADCDAIRILMVQGPATAAAGIVATADSAATMAERGPKSATGALLGSPILQSESMTGQVFSRKLTMWPAGRGSRSARMVASTGRRSWRYRRSLPTYIPARSFAGALIDLVTPDAVGQVTMDTIQHSIALMPDSVSTLKASLRALAASTGGDIGLFRASVERWYDDHMDRVSGWYKRHVAKITLVAGTLLVLLFNINALTIGRTLYNGSTTRAAMNAVTAKSNLCPSGPGQLACLTNLQAQLPAAIHPGVPIGWGTVADCAAPETTCNWLDQRGIFSPLGNSGWQVVLILIGFLIMIIMLVPGAQFWFGLVGRLGILRSGRPGILRAVSVPAPQSQPEPSAVGSGAGGAGGTPPPPASGPSGFFGWFRRVTKWFRRMCLRWLARRNCNVTGFVAQRTAGDAASMRRSRVEQALFGVGQPVLLELPDGLSPNVEAEEEVPRYEAAARQVMLEWQLSAPQLLLLSRVCDTVDVVVRRLESPAVPPGSPPEETSDSRQLHLMVALRLVPGTARRLAPDLFPWRVIVETDDPVTLSGALRQYADWYGIGVHVTKGKPIKRRGGCVHAGGMDGTIGGMVQIGSESYGLTCAHVIGADCPSIKAPIKTESTYWSPDAVLLQLDGSCLTAPKSPLRSVAPLTWNGVEELLETKNAVACMRSARGRLRKGDLQLPAPYFRDKSGFVRFPTIQVHRDAARPFSKPGDSGTWVTLQDAPDQWVGMVVSGHHGGMTLCHLSGPLLRWLELLLSDKPLPSREEKHWFEDDGNGRATARMTSN
jgi:hypothetical protein